MAQCEKNGERCPAFYECKKEGDTIWNKKFERDCFYCLATPKGREIGHKASWTGRTSKWCPRGRE